jgi:hypothetical protein
MTSLPKEGGGIKDFVTLVLKALLLKCVTMGGGGVKNCQKFRDVIDGRPLINNNNKQTG